jgi:hypothetical protein
VSRKGQKLPEFAKFGANARHERVVRGLDQEMLLN